SGIPGVSRRRRKLAQGSCPQTLPQLPQQPDDAAQEPGGEGTPAYGDLPAAAGRHRGPAQPGDRASPRTVDDPESTPPLPSMAKTLGRRCPAGAILEEPAGLLPREPGLA